MWTNLNDCILFCYKKKSWNHCIHLSVRIWKIQSLKRSLCFFQSFAHNWRIHSWHVRSIPCESKRSPDINNSSPRSERFVQVGFIQNVSKLPELLKVKLTKQIKLTKKVLFCHSGSRMCMFACFSMFLIVFKDKKKRLPFICVFFIF